MTKNLSLVIALVLAAATAHAQQKLYKSILPDGSVVYSEKPAPNAKKVDTITAPPTQGVTIVTPQDRARAEQLSRERATKQGAASNDVDSARKALQQAEAARESAKEPQAGERLGTVKGGSRLTDDYFTRQKAADEAVEKARQRVQELERR